MPDADNWYDGPDDNEFPEDDDADDSADTITCRECGAEIFEDVPICPHCGWAVTPDTGVWSNRSWWWILLGLLGITAVVGSLVYFPG